jgi:general secretion pathway protein A
MYESYFGFHGQPFQLNPDPAFYFNSRGHGRALAYLQYGVTQSEGFIVITGEIGAGKTTLVRMLLEGLDRQKVLPAQIVSTQLESGELLQAIITAFGIPSQGTSKAHLIATLEAFLTALAAQGRHALLIVDEAQNLDPRAVEELRMLSNFQLGNKALLQSFLVGQPELRRLLESASMEQLRQRVTASYHLGPLGIEETQGYVQHRLKHVGWSGRPSFDEGAFDSLYRWTGGVPRRINRLCNRVLLASFLDGTDVVNEALVERTALELREEIGESDFTPSVVPSRAPAAPAVVLPAVEPEPIAALAVDPLPQLAEPSAMPVDEAAADPTPAGMDADAAELATLAAVDPLAIEPVGDDLLEDVDALLAVSARQLAVIAARVQADSELDLESIAKRVMLEQPAAQLPTTAVERTQRAGTPPRSGVLLCVADTASAALKFAALAKRLAEQAGAPRMVLVNPGVKATVWPWEQMERLLPSLEIGLHLGAPAGADLERVLPLIFERFGRVLDEFNPVAVLTLGEGDALLASALCARRRHVPLIRVEAGREHVCARPSINGALLDQIADLLFASARPGVLRGLQRQGIAAERVYSIPGLLQIDALAAVWKEVSTAYGAFMRHGLPIYLGPTWSEHAGAGTPYVLCGLTFDPNDPAAIAAAVTTVLSLPQTDKVVWILDRAATPALRSLLADRPDLAGPVVLVEGDGPRGAEMREQMDLARVLCREVDVLPDQLSMLRGANWALLEPGQVLVEAADLLSLPTLLSVNGRLVPAAAIGGPVMDGDASDADQRDAVSAWISGIEPGAVRESLADGGGAVEVLQAHLRGWIGRQHGVEPAPVAVAA